MSKLDELIREKCNKVEYKRIDDVCDFITGFAFKNSLFKESGEGIVRTTNIQNNKVVEEDMVYFSLDDYKENLDKYIIHNGSIIIGMSGTIKVARNTSNKEYYLNQRVGMFQPHGSINNDFLFHVLNNSIDELYLLCSGSSVKNLGSKELCSYRIPIPPIEVQEEIVRVLDKFSELEAELEVELEVELEARRSQYEFWRGKLLGKEYVELKLQDVLTIKNGKDYKHLGRGDIPVYGSGGIMTYVNDSVYDKPTVLIPRKGSLGNVFYVDTPFWNVDTIYYTMIDESKAVPKYIYYFIKNAHLDRLNIAGGVPSMTQATLNNLKIQLPSLEEQERIVNILDKFDKLVNDILAELPAEIEARRKQYEYYRNKLLSFEELKINE